MNSPDATDATYDVAEYEDFALSINAITIVQLIEWAEELLLVSQDDEDAKARNVLGDGFSFPGEIETEHLNLNWELFKEQFQEKTPIERAVKLCAMAIRASWLEVAVALEREPKDLVWRDKYLLIALEILTDFPHYWSLRSITLLDRYGGFEKGLEFLHTCLPQRKIAKRIDNLLNLEYEIRHSEDSGLKNPVALSAFTKATSLHRSTLANYVKDLDSQFKDKSPNGWVVDFYPFLEVLKKKQPKCVLPKHPEDLIL